jgi:hypothetical protein
LKYSILDVIRMTAIVALASYVLLMLCTGGYTYTAFGVTIKSREIYLPIILLVMLVHLRFPLRYSTFSRQFFSPHRGAILFSVFLVIYLANGKTIGSGDTRPTRYLPLSLIQEGNFDLNEFPFLYARGTPYYLQPVKGRYVSNYPVAPALVALPFYLPSALGRVNPESRLITDLEKLSAATIVALSAVVLYFALLHLTSRRMALLSTAVYALGTSSLSVSSQALWQHGPSQLALTAALYCLVRGRACPLWIAGAGFPLAFAVIARPPDVLIALPLGAYVLRHYPRQAWGFLLCGLPPVLFQLWYNATYFDNPLRTQFPLLGGELWGSPFWEGLAGILLSPGRGLFVYSPVFLLSLPGIILAWRRNADPLLRYLSVGAVLTVILYSKWAMWWGGHAYGPRLLADLTPILVLFLYPLAGFLHRSLALKGLLVVLVSWSVSAHAIGAFRNDSLWNAYMEVDRFPQRLWSWTDNQLVNPPLQIFRRAVIAARTPPTSRTAPELLSASYRLNPPQTITTTPSRPIQLSLEAVNEGQAVWLARPERGAGVVKLEWRWLTGTGEALERSGVERLLYDIFPRQAHRFGVALDPPQESGSYLLEVGLMVERTGRFADFGSPPVRLPVKVDPSPG